MENTNTTNTIIDESVNATNRSIMDEKNSNQFYRKLFEPCEHSWLFEIKTEKNMKNKKYKLKDKMISKYIKKIYINYSKKTVVIETLNGEKFKATCSKEDYFDPYVGVAIAYFNSLFHKEHMKKWLDKKIKENTTANSTVVIDLEKNKQ